MCRVGSGFGVTDASRRQRNFIRAATIFTLSSPRRHRLLASTPHFRLVSPLRQTRLAISIVIFGLVLSGVTAFPLLNELNLLCNVLGSESERSDLTRWIFKVRDGLANTYRDYPFIAYGTDWLAFGHLMIALFFILPYRDPVRYEGVLKIGIAVSLLVIPLALICGPIRGIPLFWRLIDCSFGILCIPLLVFALRKTRQLDGYRT